MGMHLKKATIAKMLLVALNWSAYPVVAMASEAQHRNSTIMFPSKSSARHAAAFSAYREIFCARFDAAAKQWD